MMGMQKELLLLADGDKDWLWSLNVLLTDFRDNKTLNRARKVFIIFTQESVSIPDDVMTEILQDMQKQVNDYTAEKINEERVQTADLMASLDFAIKFRDRQNDTQKDIFKQFAVEFGEVLGLSNEGRLEPWELLRERWRRNKKKNNN